MVILIFLFNYSAFAEESEIRIVSTYHPSNSLIFGLKAHEMLVGLSRHADKVPLFRKIYPEMSELPQVGSRHSGVNIEEVVSLEPDLIILPPFLEGREYAERFNELGLNTININLEKIDDFFISLTKLGKEINKQDKADSLIALCKNMLTRVEENIPDQTEKPSCYYASQRNFLNTCTEELLQSVMMEKAGGKNIARDLSGSDVTITKEQLLLWNPDYIFLSQNSDLTLKSLSENEIYSKLKAVKNKHIYKFPSKMSPWDYPSIEIFPAILWISTKIYPEQYKHLDFLEILNSFYNSVYGMTFTELGGTLDE